MMKRALLLLCASSVFLTAQAGPESEYPVFVNEDQGVDTAVPAEQGGKGFGEWAEKNGWTTNKSFGLIGDPRAKKGGELIRHMVDYPSNFRPAGPQANTDFNYMARDLMYEGLLEMHPDTLEFIPSLATHWKKSPDNMTFWFRINPNARWSDGSPITSADVLATWKLHTDPTLGSPSDYETYMKYKTPVCESKYIVKVECQKRNWRNFLYFSGMHILPAKVLDGYQKNWSTNVESPPAEPNAGNWGRDYNTKFMMVSGPYEMDVAEQDPGKRVSIRRRKDYWGWNRRSVIGRYNFDRVSRVVISEDFAAIERLKQGTAGDINCYLVATAKRWVLEMTPKKIAAMKNNALIKRKIFNQQPQGFMGVALNMHNPILKDVKVRKALSLLLPRKSMLKQLMYNQYLPTRSYWPGSMYENADNPKNEFNPRDAIKLLAEAGYAKRNSAGQLLGPTGEPLVLRLLCASPAFEKHLTMYQESCKKVGVTILLELTRSEQLWTRVQEKKYEMATMAWGALLFPNPETSFKSTLGAADSLNNNNITGIQDPRLDKLIAEYDTYELEDQAKRIECIKQMDAILSKEIYPYVLFWYAPYERFLFWNVFGFPKNGLSRTGDQRELESLWWYDAEKAALVEKARKDPSIMVPPPNDDPSGIIRGWIPKKGDEGDDEKDENVDEAEK